MTIWPKDTTAAKNAFYGDFHAKAWGTLNLIHITAPFQMYYDGKKIPSILVHKKIAPAILAAFAEIWEACGKDQAKIDKLGVSAYGGCFNIRNIAGSNNWSNHSWAAAIDLAPNTNGFNTGKGTMSPTAIAAFKRQGALWGGDYKGRTDPMHFEFVSR